MRALRRGLALPPGDRWIALQAVGLLPLAALWLRLRGFNRVHERLRRHLPEPASADLDRARRIAAVVNAVARRGPYKANCLKRTVVSWWLVGRRGIATDIRFGVKPGTPPAFHSWLEIDGMVVNDVADVAARYLPFAKPVGRDATGRFD